MFWPIWKISYTFYSVSLGTSLNIEESVFGCFLLASPNNKIKPYIFFKFVYDVQIQ